jgi:hypothetical protein
MPGLGMADLLNRVFFLRQNGQSERAFDLFGKVLPHIVYSLQNLELYLYTEKRLLQARGLLSNVVCRNANYIPDPASKQYVDELTDLVLKAIESSSMT